MSSHHEDLEAYRKYLPSILNREGDYVLIGNANLVGVFVTLDEALENGYRLFSPNNFLVHQIRAIEPVSLFLGPTRVFFPGS